jgi:Protein of unknown function (DUF3667)
LSHLPQRMEKNCLNCGTEVIDRYCHHCGQENLETKESFWHLITHFFYDFTHFDGKFFSTLKYLIIKPGFVSAEYMKGRRASYLHPIRMYIFTSAFFFIIFFWIYSIGNIDFSKAKISKKDSIAWLNTQEMALKGADNHEDSMDIMEVISKVKAGIPIESVNRPFDDVKFSLDTLAFKSMAEYDSVQAALPPGERDNWLGSRIRRREIVITEKYGGKREEFWKDVLNNFLHQFPKLFFISLPIFAFILKLLYIRRKKFFYADHAIFTIHLYIFSYILFLVVLAFEKLDQAFPSSVWDWLAFILWLYWLYYTYRAMRNFYKQGRGKTIVKYFLLNFAAFLIIIILFISFFTYSVLLT